MNPILVACPLRHHIHAGVTIACPGADNPGRLRTAWQAVRPCLVPTWRRRSTALEQFGGIAREIGS